MNKTIVASVAITTFSIVCLGYIYFYARKTETRDRLTVCMQMVMQESRNSNQPVNIDKAKEICG